MAKIIVNTTFREFAGDKNDKMQIAFLRSLQRQTMQDFILVVSIFGEQKVAKTVRTILQEKCVFVYDNEYGKKYQFSLSKTFLNGVDYGLQHNAEILLDCSSDIILQKNFLEVMAKYCTSFSAGISHPNIFMQITKNGEKLFYPGKINRGIDARFFSLDIFKNEHVYGLLKKFPSYDYGAGIEKELCCIAIKYAKKRYNIFMESRVLKVENDRDGVTGKVTAFMREGNKRNIPTVIRFMESENLSSNYIYLAEINGKYRITRYVLLYHIFFAKELIQHRLGKLGFVKDYN